MENVKLKALRMRLKKRLATLRFPMWKEMGEEAVEEEDQYSVSLRACSAGFSEPLHRQIP